jgi:hypothetical protein
MVATSRVDRSNIQRTNLYRLGVLRTPLLSMSVIAKAAGWQQKASLERNQ